MSLRLALTLPGVPASRVAERLTCPALWPEAPALAERLARCRAPGAGLAAGEAWLVAVHESRRRGSLWRLTARPSGHAAEFVDDALDEAQRALPRALDALEILPRVPSAHSAPRSRAALLCAADGEVAEASVRGRSFGLAMILAAASRVLDRPLPDGALATAAVGRAGEILPVAYLDEKVDFVVEYALGVTTLLVAAAQAAEVRARVEVAAQTGRLHGRTLRVLGVGDTREAVTAVFPDLEDALLRRWSSAGAADDAARALLGDLLRGDRHTDNWPGVLRAAELLAARATESAAPRARWAAFIARRRTGRGGLLAWPDAAALARDPPDQRWTALAQVLQSAADHASDDAVAARYLDASAEHVNEYALACPDGRRFLGARARALAATDRVDEASALLDAVVEAWFRGADDDLRHGSFALAELLRLRAFVGGDDDVARALAWAERFDAHAPTSTTSVGARFVRHAWGRCLVERGRCAEALPLLNDDDDVESLRPAQCRWRARALDALGRSAEADALRAALAARADTDVPWRLAASLAALDGALARGEDHRAPLRAFARVGDGSDELLRLLRHRGVDAETCDVAQARTVAARFRY
jgi:hypothetical protein